MLQRVQKQIPMFENAISSGFSYNALACRTIRRSTLSRKICWQKIMLSCVRVSVKSFAKHLLGEAHRSARRQRALVYVISGISTLFGL